MVSEKETTSFLTQKAIPIELTSISGWKEIPIIENGEPLVPLGPFSSNDIIFTHSIYFGEKKDSPYPSGSLEGGLITMFVRKEVAEQLKHAQNLLPKGMHLIAFDTYRTLQVQQSLYDVYFEELKKIHLDWDEEQLSKETQKFVSVPSTNPTRPSPHNTGGAVDVAIFSLPEDIENQIEQINAGIEELGIDNWERVYQLEMRKIALTESNMHLLNFGTKFDYGGVEASLSYFEKLSSSRELNTEEQEVLSNRRLLFNVMIESGFEPYPDEWWHYNSKKSQMGAKIAGINNAEYGAIHLSQENLKHEEMRKGHLLGSTRIYNSEFTSKLGYLFSPSDTMRAARVGVSEIGDIRSTQSPMAAVIKPEL